MHHKLNLKWMKEQVDKLEESVTKQCDFCVGEKMDHRDFPIANDFNEQAKASRTPTVYDTKRINKIRLIEEYINHYEFLVLEEILILKKQGEDFNEWNKILERLESARHIIDKLTTTLQYSLDIQSHSSIDTLSKVSFIFLPLTFITGYFGMNFTTMGMIGKNVNKNGVLMWKHGHTFVRLLLLFILIASIIILYFIEKSSLTSQATQQTIASLVQAQSVAADDL